VLASNAEEDAVIFSIHAAGHMKSEGEGLSLSNVVRLPVMVERPELRAPWPEFRGGLPVFFRTALTSMELS
jgi:hypothetical protein